MSTQPFFKVFLCSLIFFFYQYGYYFIVSFIRQDAQSSLKSDQFKIFICICYFIICPVAIHYFCNKAFFLKQFRFIVFIIGFVYAALLYLGLKVYEADNKTNANSIYAFIIAISTPIYFLILYVFISYLRYCNNLITKGFCLSIVQSFDLIQIYTEQYFGNDEGRLLNYFLYSIILSAICSPILALIVKSPNQVNQKELTSSKLVNLCYFIGCIVMTNAFLLILQGDYASYYIEQMNDAETFYLIQAISQFVSPIVIVIAFRKKAASIFIYCWLFLSIFMGCYYLSIKIIYNTVNFYILSVLMGIAHSSQLIFVIVNESFNISYYLISISLSSGGFFLYQICVGNLFQEGLIGCLIIQGAMLMILLSSNRKLKKE